MQSNQVVIHLPHGAPPGDFDRLADAVRVAGYNAVPFSDSFHSGTNAAIERIRGELTEREFEIFQAAIVEGMSTPEVAEARGESRRSVAQLLAAIQQKLKADGREGLLRLLLMPPKQIH